MEMGDIECNERGGEGGGQRGVAKAGRRIVDDASLTDSYHFPLNLKSRNKCSIIVDSKALCLSRR